MAEELDAAQVREHIEMVERILAESSQRLCFGSEYFIVWGIYAGITTSCAALATLGALAATPAVSIQLAALAVAIVFTIWRARTTGSYQVRRSIVQREFFNVLWLATGLAFVLNVLAYNLFPGPASAAVWGFAELIVLFFIGMHGNRRAQVAGIVVLASMIAANFMHGPSALFVLGAGMALGYAGFGVAELLARE